MKLKSLIQYLESIAPPVYQEGYDNSGLIVGDPNMKIRGVMICLDSTEAVLTEALRKKCNVVIAHHPIVFKGLKKLNGSNYVERVVIKAIKNEIAIYAIHTNLDNMYHQGVNAKIAERLSLENTRILQPKATLKKLFTFVPVSDSDRVRAALFAAGAGSVSDLHRDSYASVGMGTTGRVGAAAVKLEVLFSKAQERQIVNALLANHPAKVVPYDIVSVENRDQQVGSGMIGELRRAQAEKYFLQRLKRKMKASVVRHTKLLGKPIHKVAVCGGSGGFLLRQAIAQGADVFITADYKYHEFFDADGQYRQSQCGHRRQKIRGTC
ncbi:MAG: Nif3-like dinuclear metal center hexameric protein, partial [Bacteroidota bacterium]